MAFGISGIVILFGSIFYSFVHAAIWKKTRNKHDWIGALCYEFWYM